MSRFGKKKIEHVDNVELNVMPFIDVFSLLCTFLLFTAVFVSIGIHEVQVPFISHAAPSSQGVKSQHPIEIKIFVSSQSISLTASISDEDYIKKITFNHTDQGLKDFHNALLELKRRNVETEKVTLFTDDDVKYDLIVKILDMTKVQIAGDPVIEDKAGKNLGSILFPKVVLGSVIL